MPWPLNWTTLSGRTKQFTILAMRQHRGFMIATHFALNTRRCVSRTVIRAGGQAAVGIIILIYPQFASRACFERKREGHSSQWIANSKGLTAPVPSSLSLLRTCFSSYFAQIHPGRLRGELSALILHSLSQETVTLSRIRRIGNLRAPTKPAIISSRIVIQRLKTWRLRQSTAPSQVILK